MPYVVRDTAGRIVGVSAAPTASAREWLEDSDPGLRAFIAEVLQRGEAEAPAQVLAESDLQLIRVVEDLVQVLIEKGAIQFIDLPLAARNKLMQRMSLRQSADALKLIGDDHGLI